MSSPVDEANAAFGVGNQYSADAFEGDSGQANATDPYKDSFDNAGFPGLNTGVAGTTVTPGELPVPGAVLNGEIGHVATSFDPASLAGVNNANAALPGNLMSSLDAAPGDEAGGAGGAPPGAPGGAQIPPIDWVSGGGSLAAIVPFADSSLADAVQSAASGAGGQATLFSSNVSLSGNRISASSGSYAASVLYGSEGGSAPQFHGGGHWFGPTVQSWYDAMVQRLMAQQQQGGAAAGAIAAGGATGGGIPAEDVPGMSTDAFGQKGVTYAPGARADVLGEPIGQAVTQSGWSRAWLGDLTSPAFGDAPDTSAIDAALNGSLSQWAKTGSDAPTAADLNVFAPSDF